MSWPLAIVADRALPGHARSRLARPPGRSLIWASSLSKEDPHERPVVPRGYDFVVSIEHEDRKFEGTEELVKRGFYLSRDVLAPYIV